MNNVTEHESYNLVEESAVEFCEKCGALMLPKKKDDKPILKCRECGHEISVKTP
ncbi:MAG: hypothetical protein ACW98J_11030, partial [Candidatus Thorarchaeota archaeon]